MYVLSVPNMSSAFTLCPTVQPVTPLPVFKVSSKLLIYAHKMKTTKPS
jgi:hypothetical protein